MALTLLLNVYFSQPSLSPFTQPPPCFLAQTKNKKKTSIQLIRYSFSHICTCMISLLRTALCVFFYHADKLVASAQSGGFKEKPRRETHADVPRRPRPRRCSWNNTVLRVQPHRHDLQRAGQRPRQPSRPLQNPRGR